MNNLSPYKQLVKDAKKSIEENLPEIKEALRNSQTNEGKTSEESTMRIVQHILSEIADEEISVENIFVAIAVILQKGGTSPKQPGTEYYLLKNGKKLTLDQVRKACTKNKTTPRRLARSWATDIAETITMFGEEMHIPGNLAKSCKAALEDVAWHELVWASDFQTHNEDCPPHIRRWLIEDYHRKFRG